MLGYKSGIVVKGNNTIVKNNLSEDTRTGSERTQEYGLYIDTESNNTLAFENRFLNNLKTGQLIDLGTFSTVRDNFIQDVPDAKLNIPYRVTNDLLKNFTNNQNVLSGWIDRFGIDFNMTKVLDGTWYHPNINKN